MSMQEWRIELPSGFSGEGAGFTLGQVKGYEVICLRLQLRQVFFLLFRMLLFPKEMETRSVWVLGKEGHLENWEGGGVWGGMEGVGWRGGVGGAQNGLKD